MARGKFEAPKPRKRFSGKVLMPILALMLVLGSVVSGTVAWLVSKPDPVINTFTYGDVSITLTETDTKRDDDNDPNTNEYAMVPGQSITKDPIVTVLSGSEEMWLFVKLDESDNFDTFLSYTVDGSWAQLEGVAGVYYRHITAEEVAADNMEIHVLANDTVTVNSSVTREMLQALNPDGQEPTYPTLTITAYAVQYAGNASVTEAWDRISNSN